MIQNIIIGGMTALLFYALFSDDFESEAEEPENSDLKINNGRYVTLSCQTCRKLKRHLEIEPNLFECAKCKRKVDIRIS